MLVYLIRHGETDLNKEHRLQGQTDIKLNDYGRELAKETGAALKNINFDEVFSSPLSRAYETALLIAGEKEVAIIKDARIQEISFGEYEGLSYGAYGHTVPDPYFSYFFEAPHLYRVPKGGESFEDVIKRTGAFWQDLLKDPSNKDKTILVSTHGCALKGILANIRETELKDFWGDGVHKNCAVTLVEVSEEKTKVVYEGKIFY